MGKIKQVLVTVVMGLIVMAGMPQTVNAGMVGTSSMLNQALGQLDQQQARQTIQAQLIELGVSSEMAKVRTASLSDQQVADIVTRLQDLPAGADAGGTILAIFIIFVITDVIGATDIFPFIHPVK